MSKLVIGLLLAGLSFGQDLELDEAVAPAEAAPAVPTPTVPPQAVPAPQEPIPPPPEQPVPPPPAPVPPPPTTVAEAPAVLPDLDDLEVCDATTIITDVSGTTKPQYYISFGELPLGVPGWSQWTPGTLLPGFAVEVNADKILNVASYASKQVNLDTDNLIDCIDTGLYKKELVCPGKATTKFTFDVTPNVQYTVRGHFAEQFIQPNNGSRTFDIVVKDFTLNQFNILNEAGFENSKALVKDIQQNAMSVDGKLSVELVAKVQQPIINAIEVFPTAEFRSAVPGSTVPADQIRSAVLADIFSLLTEEEISSGSIIDAGTTITAPATATAPAPAAAPVTS